MIQTVIKDGKPVCVTVIPYDPQTIRSMKRNGYKVKENPDESTLKPLFEHPQYEENNFIEEEN